MTHGKPCVNLHVFTRHMASHVSTFIEGASSIIRLVCRRRRGEEERKREREERRKERKKKGKEREKEEGGRRILPRFIAFRRLKLFKPRSKIRRFYEGLRFKR